MCVQLKKSDVKSLSVAVRCGKLPQLKVLSLSDNNLSGSIGYLLGGPDHPGFTSLQTLGLGNTQIKKSDMKSLSEAVRCGKLPQLEELHLSYNNLTGCIGDLLGGPDHPGFTSLQILFLLNTGLKKSDVKSLSEATRCGKLPQLEELHLSCNNLTGYIGDLLGEPDHPGFTSLQTLNLSHTNLNSDDIICLSEAVLREKLPNIIELRMWQNYEACIEESLEKFVSACVKKVEERQLALVLGYNDLSGTLQLKIRTLCEGTTICPFGEPL